MPIMPGRKAIVLITTFFRMASTSSETLQFADSQDPMSTARELEHHFMFVSHACAERRMFLLRTAGLDSTSFVLHVYSRREV